ncbi:lipase family protein [Fimbriiglobus ruber]|nr:lipase family protein [Fimbriiglobus ruber]
MMANLGTGQIGTQDQIENYLDTALKAGLAQLQTELGTWEVVWGPAVYESLSSVRADNAMYVARDTSNPGRYVVAIAATNAYSAYDWIIEDAFVARQVAWEYGTAPGLTPKVSDGTHIGLSKLQQLRPAPVFPGATTTLDEFFKSLPTGPLDITTAGHSLGGALAPVTALWLSDTRSQWDPDGRATISCLASAGPTPGNQDLVTYYEASPLGTKTNCIRNAIDVVPHAWAAADLQMIPNFYLPLIQPDLTIKGLVEAARLSSLKGNYTQIPASKVLPGVPDSSQFDAGASVLHNFAKQMAFQHVDVYFPLLGIGQLSNLLADARANAQTGLEAKLTALKQKLLRRIL